MRSRKFQAFLVFAVLVLGAEPNASAFDQDIHMDITIRALTDRGFKQFQLAKVIQGNLATDVDEEYVSGAHFVSEKFEEGSQRLREKLSDAVSQIMSCQRDRALQSLGRGFHGIQDFFAHSNAVENDPEMKLDLLHLKNPALEVSCNPQTHVGILTSGYWPDYARLAPNKCTHGEINKDDPAAGGKWFAIARDRAIRESRDYEDLFEQRLFAVLDYDTAFQLIQYLKGQRKDCPLEITEI